MYIYRTFLIPTILLVSQDVEPAAFSAAVSHFLNCLMGSSSSVSDSCSDELLSRRRSRRRRSHGSRVASLTDSVWARLSPSELWGRIRNEAADYYHYTIDRCVSGGVDLCMLDTCSGITASHPLCVQ